MQERRKRFQQLHDELSVLHFLDGFHAGGIFEENFIWYSYCCLLQNLITERLFASHHVLFPEIPYAESLKHGFFHIDFKRLIWEHESIDLNDAFMALSGVGVEVHHMGVDLEDRENALLGLPSALRPHIRSRWVDFGPVISDFDIDIVLAVPGLREVLDMHSRQALPEEEEALLSLCIKILPLHSKEAGPSIVYVPEVLQAAYIHFFYFCSDTEPYAESCFSSRSIFFAVYALKELCICHANKCWKPAANSTDKKGDLSYVRRTTAESLCRLTEHSGKSELLSL